MKPKKIALYGNFGSGNLGNECTLQVVVEHLRQTWPDAQLLCLCAVPDDVRSRHHVRAVRSALYESGWTWAQLEQDPRAPMHEPAATSGTKQKVSRMLRIALRRVPLELIHWLRGFTLLVHMDMLVIPGTQIVSDYLCGPSGWPYDIFKWSTLAALSRTNLVFLSIGVGPLRHPLSRWLIRKSLLLARYRSYRDEQSRRYATSIGLPTERDAVYPDLVFSLSRQYLAPAPPRTDRGRVVGLGLKDYSGTTNATAAQAYQHYLDTMADFVAWLHAHGYRVRLLIGDAQYDLKPRRELCALLQRRKIDVHPPRLVADDPHGVGELLAQLGATDVVVSPRLHNLILAALLDKPLLALSDHAKLDSLLAGLGLTEYRVPLETLSLDALIAPFVALERNADRARAQISTATARYRNALHEQYARVFPVGSAAT